MEVTPCAGPSDAAGSGAGDDELLWAFDLKRAGMSQPAIAVALWGAGALAGGWHDENPFPNRVRRRLERATYLVDEGYLKLAARP